LENCETSAIGRALAAAGYGGEEYASANEVQNAIQQQNQEPVKNRSRTDQEPIKKRKLSKKEISQVQLVAEASADERKKELREFCKQSHEESEIKEFIADIVKEWNEINAQPALLDFAMEVWSTNAATAATKLDQLAMKMYDAKSYIAITPEQTAELKAVIPEETPI